MYKLSFCSRLIFCNSGLNVFEKCEFLSVFRAVFINDIHTLKAGFAVVYVKRYGLQK